MFFIVCRDIAFYSIIVLMKVKYCCQFQEQCVIDLALRLTLLLCTYWVPLLLWCLPLFLLLVCPLLLVESPDGSEVQVSVPQRQSGNHLPEQWLHHVLLPAHALMGGKVKLSICGVHRGQVIGGHRS